MAPAVEQLWDVYREWKTLTEQEGSAIRSADWPRVHKTQEEKRQLQSEIIQLTDRIKADFTSQMEQARFDDRMRSIVNELILLETRNNGNLQASLDSARRQKRDLDTTSSRLRQIHNRYVPSRDAVWENVS